MMNSFLARESRKSIFQVCELVTEIFNELSGLCISMTTVYCDNCEKDVVPNIDDEWPFDSICPDCGVLLEEGV